MKTKRPATIPTLTTEQMKGLLTILADAFKRQSVKTIKRTRKRQGNLRGGSNEQCRVR